MSFLVTTRWWNGNGCCVSATWDVCTHTSTTPALHLATLWHWLSSLVAPHTLLAAQTQSHWCWASPLALNPHCSQGECWWATAEWALSDLEGSPLAVTLSCPLEISKFRSNPNPKKQAIAHMQEPHWYRCAQLVAIATCTSESYTIGLNTPIDPCNTR